ncbi:MAG TPA: hypothetical protein VM571_13840 [Noviherbaspirillum sp.]|nr:hypothetical protein [Noviherbaspirillum sp.]
MRERPISVVPRPVLLLLALAFTLQLGWHLLHPAPVPRAEDLEPPPPLAALQVASFGEQIGLGKLLMLYVQAFDNQPGLQLPFAQLDYERLQAWLGSVLALDPRGQYPLLSASRLYADVADPAKKRQMLEFVYTRFFDDPARRWPSLAHAAIIAKHQLKDLPLARKYAQAIRERTQGMDVPAWASQMEIFILEDMNELDSAKILIGGLLQSGQIDDPNERRFLAERLKDMDRPRSEQ